MRAPLTIMAVLAVLLYGLWALTEGSAQEAAPAREASPASVAEIARRVEALRGLRFDAIPRPVAVTPEQARREGLEDLDRSYPEARRRADEQVLKLLGLIDPAVDLRDVSASVFSEGVAGYYDPRTKRMRTVRGAATGTRVLAEMVLAHELTHALEDQRFGLGLEDQGGSDDAALARLALVEGSASELMYAYARRHFTPEETLGGVLGSAFADTGRCPASCRRSSCSRTPAGQAFVAALRERAGGRWTLVDLAERSRPPASTEQVMHPAKWVRRGAAAAGADAAPARALGPGWERAAGGVLGEFQTRELLARRGRRRLGARPPRAGAGTATSCGAAGRGRGLRSAVPARCRADRPLALGHARRLAGVRGEAPPVGPRRARRHAAGRRHLRDRRRARRRGGARRRGDARDGAVGAAGPAPCRRGVNCGSSRQRDQPIRWTCARSSAASPHPPARPAAAARAPTPSPAPAAGPTWAPSAACGATRRWSGCSAARSSAA